MVVREGISATTSAYLGWPTRVGEYPRKPRYLWERTPAGGSNMSHIERSAKVDPPSAKPEIRAFFARVRQVAQDPESKPTIENRWSYRNAMNKPIKQGWTTGDISGFGFALTLVLSGTIFSAYSDRPVFWLLVGPGPLVMGLTLISFLRYKR